MTAKPAKRFSAHNRGAEVRVELEADDGTVLVYARPVGHAVVALGHLRDAVDVALEHLAREAQR